ncbi:peptidoglycan-binding protein [Luteimonas fraxinea]|uniref:Peptidoglycan-binding protein n=1 Tax=Luteimonas fraxinea TaxID=2901869 RepID=A0ABS8UGY1_9GAMM|nr:peptidoglycan-binding protein [Luteimonas fraxinea]MCD9098102.1 peptidoglycan-binding protein [Luteimonas fraxinea]MCD9125367.1 peptidoglycan-binding protein [Luteimonas fraxinea]UHH09172.1 peptidoglycan-binding protein [Luteimonas fraxinea]
MAGNHDRAAVLDIIEREAAESGIPRDDFLRFAYIETGGKFNADAHNRESGAKGLFQFMPRTAAEFGITGREFDATANTDAAAALYARNRTQITNRSNETGYPFLSGAESPNGLDMYLAHQQGGGGYASIQRAIATGEFSGARTRTNILGNIDDAEFSRLTGHRQDAIARLSDRDLATSFTQYWTAKYAAIAIPDRGIEATAQLPGAAVRPDPLADGVLSRSERGQDVRALQESLNTLGYRDGQGNQLETTSGIYGQRTEEAVRSFQAARGAEQTGRADEATRQAITDQISRPEAERTSPPAPERSGATWPAPGNTEINQADKPREGRGEFGTPRSSGKPHGGIDIQGEVGDPIVAFAGGVVQVAPGNADAGNTVRIQHDDGSMTKYFHLDAFSVRNGQRVEAGDQIGTMGRTGNTPAHGDTHLHFELLRDGRRVDPMPVLRGSEQTSAADVTRAALSAGALQLGANGAAVIALQEQLNQLGYRGEDGQPLETRSGTFGTHTDHALRALQADSAIKVDGIFGGQSQDAVASAVEASRANDQLMQHGANGPGVAEFQSRLHQLGFSDASGRALSADGKFGDSTREAVLNLQRSAGIRVDGIVGPETRGKMEELERSRPAEERTEQESALRESQGDFVQRMLAAARDADGLDIRRLVDNYASSEQGQQWQKQSADQAITDPAKASQDLSR